MSPVDPLAVEAELAAYYDAEGEGRATRPIDPRRLAARDALLSCLGPQRDVLEIGPGPGRDTRAFAAAGHRVAAVELSMEHARRCSGSGAAVARATVRQLPFRDGRFDAVWSMSTLMHVPDKAIGDALDEIRRVLRPGATATLGVWGGPDIEGPSPDDEAAGRPPRLFSRRSAHRWASLLLAIGAVESSEVWGDGADFFYQLVTVRRPSPG